MQIKIIEDQKSSVLIQLNKYVRKSQFGFAFYEVQGSVQLDENLENSSHMTRFKDLPLGEENY